MALHQCIGYRWFCLLLMISGSLSASLELPVTSSRMWVDDAHSWRICLLISVLPAVLWSFMDYSFRFKNFKSVPALWVSFMKNGDSFKYKFFSRRIPVLLPFVSVSSFPFFGSPEPVVQVQKLLTWSSGRTNSLQYLFIDFFFKHSHFIFFLF